MNDLAGLRNTHQNDGSVNFRVRRKSWTLNLWKKYSGDL